MNARACLTAADRIALAHRNVCFYAQTAVELEMRALAMLSEARRVVSLANESFEEMVRLKARGEV